MPNIYDSLITELRDRMDDQTGTAKLFNTLNGDLPDPKTTAPELSDAIDAFQSHATYTSSTFNLLNNVTRINATLETLTTATNLVQFYFQVTQPLDRILSNLVSLLSSHRPADFGQDKLDRVNTDIHQIAENRKLLQNSLKRALQEFGSAIDGLGLEQLLQNSSTILKQLKDLNQMQFVPPDQFFEALSTTLNKLIDHLKSAQGLFKTFNRKSEELTGNEPDEIKQLIRNWGEAVGQIEKIEQKDAIQNALNDSNKNRLAIAQTIQVQDLLEVNYDYLTALIRSGDLESAGIL